MLFWTLQRIFGTCTLIVYVIPLLWLDWPEAKAEIWKPLTIGLIMLQGFRHSSLGMTIGFHRYYSHAAFKARRWVEFMIAYSCAASNQGAMTWWAGNHRHHNSNCDTLEDPHSPVARSIPYAWIGWTYDLRNSRRKVRLTYPEIVWLDKWCFLIPWMEWAAVWSLTGSLAFATWVVLLPAWLSPIGTLFFNVLSHGGKPDEKGCAARKYRSPSAILLGEHDHLDHHIHPGKAHRPGPDLPYNLVLRPLARMGLVWDLRKT